MVLPAQIGAERICHLIRFPKADNLSDNSEKSHCLREELNDPGPKMEEIIQPADSP